MDQVNCHNIFNLVKGFHQIFGAHIDLMGEECYTEVCKLAHDIAMHSTSTTLSLLNLINAIMQSTPLRLFLLFSI